MIKHKVEQKTECYSLRDVLDENMETKEDRGQKASVDVTVKSNANYSKMFSSVGEFKLSNNLTVQLCC